MADVLFCPPDSHGLNSVDPPTQHSLHAGRLMEESDPPTQLSLHAGRLMEESDRTVHQNTPQNQGWDTGTASRPAHGQRQPDQRRVRCLSDPGPEEDEEEGHFLSR